MYHKLIIEDLPDEYLEIVAGGEIFKTIVESIDTVADAAYNAGYRLGKAVASLFD